MKEENKLVDTESDFSYLDILFLEHPNPRKHPRQSHSARAGQFSPFAALSGYDGQIKEVSRYTSKKKILSDSEKDELDQQLHFIQQCKNDLIQITYFEQDLKKVGGQYKKKCGTFHHVDLIHRLFYFHDKTSIKMQDIVKIDIIESSD